MRAIRLLLGALLAASVVAVFIVAATGGLINEDSAVPIALAVVDVVVAAVVGWMVQGRSRWPALGPIIQVSGLWIVASMFRHVDLGTAGLVITGGLWLAGACLPALTMWGFPDGVDDSRRRQVRLATLVVVVAAGVTALLGGGAGPGTTTSNAASPLPIPAWSRVALAVQSLLVLAFSVSGVVALARRRGRYRVGGRSALDPVVAAGALWVSILFVERAVHLLPLAVIRTPDPTGSDGAVAGLRPWVAFAAISLPLAVLGVFLATVGFALVVRPRLDRLPDGRLVLDGPTTSELTSDLATWVGDPSLRISFSDGRGGWLDEDGRTVHPDGPEIGRTLLMHDHEPVALLEHDPALRSSPEVLRFAAALAGRAIEADSWAAAADARVEESRRLASRLVTADDTTRSRLLGELDSGPLRELGECVDLLRAGAELGPVVARLKEATAETRRISHGLYPPELIDGGLRAALDDRAGTPSRRLPAAVEVTAYLLARDDPAASFVDRGTMLVVQLSAPPTDGDVIDRVSALGGTCAGVTVELPTGGV